MVELAGLQQAEHLRAPVRMMKYVLIWCSAGELSVTVDDADFTLCKGDVITITSGQVHFIKEMSSATDGLVLTFTLDFFCKDDHDIELIFHNGLFCHFAMNEVIHIQESEAIERQLQCIRHELESRPYQHLISIRSRIELILVEINRAKVKRGDEIWKPGALFLKFLEAVRDNLQHNYAVSQYAEMLSTTELKLNEQAKMHAGKTAQQVINGLVISEAKRLLLYENLSVKEVAGRLGFDDPFYFSNFFKKHTGHSPTSYQAQVIQKPMTK